MSANLTGNCGERVGRFLTNLLPSSLHAIWGMPNVTRFLAGGLLFPATFSAAIAENQGA